MLTIMLLKKFGLQHTGTDIRVPVPVEAGSGGAASKFYLEPEPHQYDAAPQH
jgi:hypothetical protein